MTHRPGQAGIVWAVILLLFTTPARAADGLVLSAMQDNKVHLIAARVAEAAMKHIGQPVTIRFVPAKRALFEANAGKVDGDVGRIARTGTDFPNLRASSVPVVTIRGFAYGLDRTHSINRWEDLDDVVAGYTRGVRIFEKNTEGRARKPANSFQELYQMLADRRVGVILATDVVKSAFEAGNPELPRLHPLGKTLVVTPLFLHLHQRHQALLPRIDRALQTLTLTGEIDRIRTAVLQQGAAGS